MNQIHLKKPGGCLIMKILSYQYNDSHYKDRLSHHSHDPFVCIVDIPIPEMVVYSVVIYAHPVGVPQHFINIW